MAILHAVLALLAEGPNHGYELKSSFEEAVGPQWGELNIGHLYQILDRLERDGLVTKRVVAQANRPDKAVYRITKAGRQELDGWLDEPVSRQAGYRDDFFLKILAASRLGSHTLKEILAIQRQAYLSELKTLGDLKAAHRDEPLVEFLIDAAIAHMQANLEIVELAKRQTRKLVAAPTEQRDRTGREATA